MKPRVVALAAILVCQSALWSAPCRADYVIPVSANPAGAGRGSQGPYQLTYTIGQASPAGVSTVLNYELAAGLMAMLSDIEPPGIAHQPAHLVPARTAVEISAEITDLRSGVDTVRLFFREGGLLAFREKAMLKSSDDTYAATLPPSSVTERGLVYYIEARDHLGNRTRYPASAPDSLVNIGVCFSSLTSTVELPAGKYRMISLPGVPTSGSPDSVLVDDLGRYDKKSWRLGRWNSAAGECAEGCYQEYPTIDAFAPGRAFWLVSSGSRSFDFGGVSTDVSRPFLVRLARGWNQIATPFGFATDWLSARIRFGQKTYAIGDLQIVGSDTIYVEDNLVAYDGAYQGFQSQLLPWAGYWVYNWSTHEVDLVCDPGPAAGRLTGAVEIAERSPGAGRLGPATDLLIAIAAKSPEHPECRCLAGLSPAAADAWDILDLHEPPPIGDYLSVAFDRQAWGRHSGAYMSDIRHSTSEGAAWEFLVQTSGRTHPSLSITPMGELPQGWHIFLYDPDAGLRLDLGSLPYSFDLERSRRFTLIAGTGQFIAKEEASSGIDLKPGIVSAVPNPFTQNVRITFFVPNRGPARLQVFSVEGRLIGTLADGVVERGLQTLVWDGKSRNGQATAPGIYFVRFETARAVITEKILKLR